MKTLFLLVFFLAATRNVTVRIHASNTTLPTLCLGTTPCPTLVEYLLNIRLLLPCLSPKQIGSNDPQTSPNRTPRNNQAHGRHVSTF
ncbi:hypothetical protein L209DRAFT_756545 [Thermothelomyces heterothallicus CBS 203.75]